MCTCVCVCGRVREADTYWLFSHAYLLEEQDKLQADVDRWADINKDKEMDRLLYNLKGWQTHRYANRQIGMQADYV